MIKYACFAHVAQCQSVIGWSQPGNVLVSLELNYSSLFTLGGDNKVIAVETVIFISIAKI